MFIGNLNVDSAATLAPMAGVADAAFRILCRELGFRGLMFTEMVSAKGLCFGDAKSLEIARIGAAERPAGIQVFGSEPDIVARAVELLGGIEADLIDINMGCPMPKITKNGEGSALMLNPELAAEIVGKAVRAAGKPVSVKIRKGWDAGRVNAVEFAKRMEDAGASMITVHGRTRDQLYAGSADWGIIAEVKRAVGVPVVGNGDVSGARGAVRMLRETGCDAVMIGRAARGNPWLLRDAEIAATGLASGAAASHAGGVEIAAGGLSDNAAISHAGGVVIAAAGFADNAAQYYNYAAALPPVPERIRVMKRHLELSVQLKGERTGVMETRKHLAWYIKGMKNAAAIRNDVFHITSYNEAIRAINRLADIVG